MIAFLLVFTVFLLVVYSILIMYYRHGWVKIKDFEPFEKNKPILLNLATRVTIIIPARNEAMNIGRCLNAIIEQRYPSGLFEVIVVDDHSTDDTALIVESFNKPNICCINLKDFVTGSINSYKKKAIEIAIAQAAGELIITTDADCFMGPDWLQTLVAFYEEKNPVFIAAPVLINNSHSFLSIFQALDFMTLQGITGAAVNSKLHNMCNGANLAYTKAAFIAVNGFKNIDTIASGDDMLLMHKIATHYPEKVLFLKSSKAIVKTQAVTNWKAFFNQRIRWASKADKYNDNRILPVLMLVYFLNLFLFLMPVIALINNRVFFIGMFQFSLLAYWFILLLIKTGIELIFLYPIAVFFEKKNILWWFPVAQPFHILYTIIAGWLGKFGSYQWKDRKVK